jgi:DNA-binding transcriptional LysR family regulator
VELRYLLYFATVAEQRSFTRAAEKLNIAQPAISQQIRTLEEELEVKLLTRTKRSVRLTAAGQVFLGEAKDILNRVEESRAHARRAAQGATGRLSIGCIGWTASLFLPGLIHTYRTRYPAVCIQLHEQLPGEQLEALESGQIDVGFTRPLPKTKASRFVQERVYRDRLVAVLPQRHALAGSQEVSLEELANEDWVLLNRSTSPEMVDGFTLLCANAGFAPRVINEAARIQTVFALVAAGMGVSLTPSYIRRFNPPGVTFVPLQPDPPPIDLVAARPKGEPPPTVAAFIDMLREQIPRIRRQYAYRRRRTSAPSQ